MKYADKIELSNIQVYEVGDVQIENLVLKALAAGIKEIVVGPCALDLVEKMLEGHDNITINCAVSYPSGAYLLEQKIQEIQDLIDEQKRIDAFYVVMSEGQYLSGHVEEMKEELKEIVHASNNIPVKIVTEISVLDATQMEEVAEAIITAGAQGVVISADFKPYDIQEPSIEQVKKFVEIVGNRIDVIGAGNVTQKERFLDMLDAGVTRVNTTNGFEILKELN